MTRTLQLLTILFTSIWLCGFSSPDQPPAGTLELLDRTGQPTTRITDGDTVRIRLTLAAAVSNPETFTFKIDDLNVSVGICDISTGATCQTDAASALGWHWDPGGVARDTRVVKAFDATGKPVAQSESVTVLPRPVVMVHGFLSSWDTWKAYLGPNGFLAPLGIPAYAVGDGQVPGVLNTGTPTNPTGTTNTIAQNAVIEGEYIAAVKKATGAQVVDLVGHSMGGMISRYYIDRVMQDRDVAQLVMLGSPMGGSDCAVLPAALGFFLPASVEIRQSYMEGVFNRQITHRRGVHFYDLAGTAISQPFQSPCAAVPNDIAVSVASVNAIPLESSRFDILHIDLTKSPAVFHDFVLPLLEKPVGSFATAADPNAVNPTTDSLQFTRVYTGHVAPGRASELSINIEPNVTVASFAMYDPTRSVDVSVRGASGSVLQLNPQANGFVRVQDPSSLVYLGYGFPNPRPGLWKVSVLATAATPATGADYAVSVYFVGGAQLSAQSSTLIPKVGEPVRFSADVTLGGQPIEITAAQAVVRGPTGKTEQLDLKPGLQAAASWTPGAPGTYGVDIVVTGRAADGSSVERTAFLAEEVQPNPSRMQVSANLVLVIGIVLLVLLLIVFFFVRLSARLFRRNTRSPR